MVRTPSLRYDIGPVETGDLRALLQVAWKTLDHLYPYAFFEAIARHQRKYFRVVHEDRTRRVLAFIIAAEQPGTTQNVLLLAVDPAFRNRGLRRALLRDVQELLTAEGRRSFSVEVPRENRELVQLYTQEGFHVVGIEPRSMGESSGRVVLAKDLA